MLDLIKNKWDDILSFMKDAFEYNEITYTTWIEPMVPYALYGNDLYVVAQNHPYIIQILDKRYKDPLSISISKVAGLDLNPVFIMESEKEDISRLQETRKEQNVQDSEEDFNELLRKKGLNPKYTFASFVPGKSNELAHAASLAVADNPGEDYKILYLYGGVGLGKTHLMHAIANYILRKNRNANILYITSEEFTNEYVESIRNKTTYRFREKYRSLDVLLIDDIQFLVNKESTQEEFFNTFNALYLDSRQIVISSDRKPQDINNLEERIKSRFEWGIVADIQQPSYETRLAILRKKEELEGYSVDDEIIKYIAANVKSNIRTLEGALQKIVFKSRLENRQIDIDTAVEILKDFTDPGHTAEKITPAKVISVVAEHYQLDIKDLLSEKRSKNISDPRQVAMYLCSEICDETLDDIGQAMGNRDHSTVIHGRKRIAEKLQEDKDLAAVIEIIKKKIIP